VDLYPKVEPHAHGMLDVGDRHRLYWEARGNPDGKPAVVLHGGPGSGCPPGLARCFDPAAYRVVLFDQRGCGRSTPHASEPDADLSTNTTAYLIADIEQLRDHLGVDAWLVFGGSWGTTLGLAYAQQHPHRVTQMILASVVTTTRREVEWVTRDMGRIFPEQWASFRNGVPPGQRGGSLVDAYSRLLHDPDPAVRDHAARQWCTWEDVHVSIPDGHSPDPRFDDPAYRLAFARLVTHYWRHAAFLEDGILLRRAHLLAGLPGVLIHGRLDISAPADIAWQLSRQWPGSELVLIEQGGHGGRHPGMREALLAATARFATEPTEP
jgi:proline iminopeptidase